MQRVISLLALLLTSVAGSAHGAGSICTSAPPALPPLADAEFEQNGWAAHRVTVGAGGGDFALRAGLATDAVDLDGLQVWVTKDTFPFYSTGIYSRFSVGIEYSAQLLSPDLTVEKEERVPGTGRHCLKVSGRLLAGEYLIVVASATDGGSSLSEASVFGGSGVTAVDTTVGSEAFLHDRQDFVGLLNASAGSSPSAAATVGAGVNHDFRSSLFSSFISVTETKSIGVPSAFLEVRGPADTTSCIDSCVDYGSSAGRYEFLARAAFDASLDRGDLLLLAADVDLPVG